MSEVKVTSGGPPVPSSTLVQTDQVTIVGDGSHERPLRGVPGGASVAVDGTTILGNGTTADPLHAGPVDGTFRAAFRPGATPAAPGQPVFVTPISLPGGVTTVQLTNAGPADLRASPDGFNFAQVAGVVARVNVDGTVQVQTGGILVLSTAQWDAVAGSSGGLTQGETYWASPGDPGAVTPDVPVLPGDFATKVGTALSSTTLLVQPSFPSQVLGDVIVFCVFSGQPLVVGSAVFVSSSLTVSPATSNVSTLDAQSVGLVTRVTDQGDPIVQLSGVVTLSASDWGAVTDTSPSMQPGTAYYVATSLNPGRLTAISPGTGARVQLGVGLSATQFALNAPFLERLS